MSALGEARTCKGDVYCLYIIVQINVWTILFTQYRYTIYLKCIKCIIVLSHGSENREARTCLLCPVN